MSKAKFLRWLHISDLHLQSDKNKTEFNNTTALDLREKLTNYIKKNKLQTDFILISGDIMFKNEYCEESLLIFMTDLCDACCCEVDKVIICPGNHEVERGIKSRNNIIDQIRLTKKEDISESNLESLVRYGYNKFNNLYKSIKGKEYEHYCTFTISDENVTCKIVSINSCLLSKDNSDMGRLRVYNKLLFNCKTDDNIDGLNIVLMHHGTDFLLKEDSKEFQVWAQNNDIDAVFCGHTHEPYRTVYSNTSYNIEEFTSGMVTNDETSTQMPTFYFCEFNPYKRIISVQMHLYDVNTKKWDIAKNRHPAFLEGIYTYKLQRQVKRSISSIEAVQLPPGTFTFFNRYRESIKWYIEDSDKLFYPEDFLDSNLTNLEEDHILLINGKQGTGKTALTLKLAELLAKRVKINGIFVVNKSTDWCTIGNWIKEIRQNNDDIFDNPKYIWIIENLHMSVGLEEDIPDISFWGNDYCILNTQDIKKVDYLNIDIKPVELIIKKDDFQNCLNAMRGGSFISRNISDKLFDWTGGNLALLRSIVVMENIAIDDIERTDFSKLLTTVYNFYFVKNANEERRINAENKNDVIKTLSLLCLDFPLPECLQNSSIHFVLYEFCSKNDNNEVRFEHASLAELLLTSICDYYGYDLKKVYINAIKWAVDNLFENFLSIEVVEKRLNNFLHAVLTNKFVFPKNNNIEQSILWDENSSIYNLVHNNISKVTAATWYVLLDEERKRSYCTYQTLFRSQVTLDDFINTIIEDFTGFKKITRVICEDSKKLIKDKLSSKLDLFAEMVNSGNELPDNIATKSLLSLISCDLIEQNKRIEFISKIFTRSGTKNALLGRTIESGEFWGDFFMFLFVMKKESPNVLIAFEEAVGAAGYLKLLSELGTIPIFSSIVQYSSDEMRRNLLSELQSHPEYIEPLIQRTIASSASLGTFNLFLRAMKKESLEALMSFEEAIGAAGYLNLMNNLGTIPILANIMEYSSDEMRKNLLSELQSHPEYIETLMQRTIDSGASMGTFNLHLRTMKKESLEALMSFEEAIGATGYLNLKRH